MKFEVEGWREDGGGGEGRGVCSVFCRKYGSGYGMQLWEWVV